MQRKIIVFAILMAPLAGSRADAQFGFNSKRETYDVNVSHPSQLSLPNVKRVVIRDFSGPYQCASDLKARLAEAITSSGKLELIDRANLGDVLGEQNLQSSSFANPETAVKLGQLLGPAAIIVGQITKCSADTAQAKSQPGFKDKAGRQHMSYFRETTARLGVTVQIIDVTTSKVNSARRIVMDVPETRSAQDALPDPADGGELLSKALANAEDQILRQIIPWRETVHVIVHADKECDLKTAAGFIRVGNFDSAAETMQKAIDRQCDAPNDKVALAKAYHNMGVALTYADKPDEGLTALQQSNMLWKGDISEQAMEAARKLIQARNAQRRQDATAVQVGQAAATEAKTAAAALLTNKDVIDMVKAKLSDAVVAAKIRTSKCRFDTAPSALIELKKAGASDAIVLALTEANCNK